MSSPPMSNSIKIQFRLYVHFTLFKKHQKMHKKYTKIAEHILVEFYKHKNKNNFRYLLLLKYYKLYKNVKKVYKDS